MPYKTLKEFKTGLPADYTSLVRYDWNTYKWTSADGVIRYRMYDTDIVAINKSVITLDNGGYYTVTTKAKINGILAILYPNNYYYIRQEKGLWYYGSGNTPFFNGMKLNLSGKVLNASKAGKAASKQLRLIKLINRYCKKLKGLKALPVPGAGDCWSCSMFERGGLKNNDHLLAHLKEGYIHGALIINVLEARGYKDPGFIFCHAPRDSIVRAVKAYFKTRLGIAR